MGVGKTGERYKIDKFQIPKSKIQLCCRHLKWVEGVIVVDILSRMGQNLLPSLNTKRKLDKEKYNDICSELNLLSLITKELKVYDYKNSTLRYT